MYENKEAASGDWPLGCARGKLAQRRRRKSCVAYHVGYYHRGIERRSDFQPEAVEKRSSSNWGGEKRGFPSREESRRTASVENAGAFRPARKGRATGIGVQPRTQPAPFPRRTIRDAKYAQKPKGMRHPSMMASALSRDTKSVRTWGFVILFT